MSDAELEVDYAIIGGGVVGLALAETLSRRLPAASIVLCERNRLPGQEISARHSGVIHAGVYYGDLPRKAAMCVRGRELLYDYCVANDIDHRRCGKYILAFDAAGQAGLSRIAQAADVQGVPLLAVDGPPLRTTLKNPQVVAGLWSPMTGIVDSHGLVARLRAQAEARGVVCCWATTFVAPERVDGTGCWFTVADARGERTRVRAGRLFNAAGLGAARVANQLWPQGGFAVRPCRGRYFALSARFRGAHPSLLYPLPDPAGGLGVHLTLDLAGQARLGPDVDWSMADAAPDDAALLRFDDDVEALAERFVRAGRWLLPDLTRDDLRPDYIGVRPKLFRHGRAHPDFWMGPGPDGVAWHLLGIESPGLTAALAVAEDLCRRL